MSFATAIANANAAILNMLSLPVVVRLNGATTKTVNGMYFSAVETLSPFSTEQVVMKPMVVMAESDANGITREYTLQPQGHNEMRIFGDPEHDDGLVKFFLTKPAGS